MRLRSWLVGKLSLASVMLLFFGNQSPCAPDWKERFLTEGVPQLRELEELSSWLQATIEEEQVSSKRTTRYLYHCCFQGPLRLSIVKPKWDWDKLANDRKARVAVEIVHGINSQYEFRIQRLKEGPFKVTAFQPIGSGASDPSKLGPRTDRYGLSLSATWILHFRPLHEWLEIKGFSIESVQPVRSAQDKTYVKVVAKYRCPQAAKKVAYGDASFDADVFLDPENHWCISRADCVSHMKANEREYDISEHVAIKFGPQIEGMPVPEMVTSVTDWPREHTGVADKVTEKFAISNVQKTGEANESKFMLASFGVSEIQTPLGSDLATSQSTAWIWYVGAGVLFIAVFGGLTWYSRGKHRGRLE